MLHLQEFVTAQSSVSASLMRLCSEGSPNLTKLSWRPLEIAPNLQPLESRDSHRSLGYGEHRNDQSVLKWSDT